MQSIFEVCEPRPEVLSGELREEIFAARLRDVLESRADPVYQDAELFFDNTYPTEGLRVVLREVMGRLSGQNPDNNAIIRLETAFGGGKTHNLIALYHIASGYTPDQSFLDPNFVLPANSIQIAGVVGTDLQPSLNHGDVTTYTLWGELAYQLAGQRGYALVADSEQTKTAPGTVILESIVGEKPTLIMLDEIARHLRSAKTVPTATGKSDLAEQTVAFLMSLFEFAASRDNVVVVFTLASASDAFGNESEELKQQIERSFNEIRRISARQERVITPTAETEIAAIVTHRLFRFVDEQAALETAHAFGEYYHHIAEQNADVPQRALRAEYLHEIESNYPFHPEVLNTLNRKTSTIPNFQRTRGALRLLAMVIRDLWESRPEQTYLIHTHHINLAVEKIANDLTSRLERPRFKQVIEADIISLQPGSQAHAQMIDEMAGGEPTARYVATTVFIHSLTQGTASGVDPSDLILATIKPGDDPALVLRAVNRLVEKGWFIEYDGRRYRFKTEPSINKIITDEMGAVGQVAPKMELDHRIKQIWKRGFFEPVYFPSEPGGVDDDTKLPKLVVVHYDAARATIEEAEPPELVMNIFNYAGTQQGYRTHKNNLIFLVADRGQIDNMVTVAQRYLAVQRITNDPQRMGEFFDEQRRKLQEMAKSIELDVRVAITKAYRWLFYPSAEAPQQHANLAREQLPPQDQGDVNQDQSAVVLRVLKQLEKVLTNDSATLPAQYVKSRAWNIGQEEISTEDLRKAFARKMNMRMLLDINQLKKTIQNGIQQKVWVYYTAQEGVGYNHQSPPAAIQISDDTYLYTPEAYQAKGWAIKGVTPIVQPDPVGEAEADDLPIPLGGSSGGYTGGGASVITPQPTRQLQLRGEGAPAQAMQGLLDACSDRKVTHVSKLVVVIEGEDKQGAAEVRALGLAIPQLGRADYWIEQEITAEFGGGENVQIGYSGGWDRYKRMKQFTDSFANENDLRLVTKTRLTMGFPDGLELAGNQFNNMVEVFSTLGFGHMIVEAEPYKE
jgi:hypothetical protein